MYIHQRHVTHVFYTIVCQLKSHTHLARDQ
jgi:hypothetical protein